MSKFFYLFSLIGQITIIFLIFILNNGVFLTYYTVIFWLPLFLLYNALVTGSLVMFYNLFENMFFNRVVFYANLASLALFISLFFPILNFSTFSFYLTAGIFTLFLNWIFHLLEFSLILWENK